MKNVVSIEMKVHCLELKNQGVPLRTIYDEYFAPNFENPPFYETFTRNMRNWKNSIFPDDTTLKGGTYKGFTAHGATVQVSSNGEIVQAWIKQHKDDSFDVDKFLEALHEKVEPYDYSDKEFRCSKDMLEIPLFDMHWGISYMDYYQPVLDEILGIINLHDWSEIIIPFGQDFFHNDSIVSGVTSKGTNIEKVDMERAVRDGRKFMYTIIDAAINRSNQVKVIYTPGNHDRSISWMFAQVLKERYSPDIVDDSIEYRKCVSYGSNTIMFTHGDSKQATSKNLAHIFPIAFPEDFSNKNVREIHAGHLHREGEADIYGIMVRRLSSGGKTDEWSNREDFIGSHKRFMLFEWDPEKLKSIHYIYT